MRSFRSTYQAWAQALSDARQQEREGCAREVASRLLAEDAHAAARTAHAQAEKLQRELAAAQATHIVVGHLRTAIFDF